VADYYLRLIPADPELVPPEKAREEARAALEGWLHRAEHVTETVTEDVRFVDPGKNLERILCPACGAAIDRRWWEDALAISKLKSFRNLRVTTPCCRAVSSLNDLDYEWPAGFARFVLEASNPNVSELPGQQLRSLSRILGCKLRQIWSRG
jgi:hypothetical protein